MAANYIKEWFTKYADYVYIQNYTVLVPIDQNTTTVAASSSNTKIIIHAYMLGPNGANPCPINRLSGRLIYAGDGELSRFQGMNVTESIVLMDYFGSADNWINAAKLGAKAVIFMDNGSPITRQEASLKSLGVPLYFPRLWISQDDGQKLLTLLDTEESVEVTISDGRMSWENVVGQNVIGVIRGTREGFEVKAPGIISAVGSIAIMAHYDSWSDVPLKAPGANDALGISTLMELMRFYSANRPLRSIIFVALSGYWQSLAGMREYIFRGQQLGNLNDTLAYFALDYSTDSPYLGLLFTGSYHQYAAMYAESNTPLARTSPLADLFFKEYSPAFTRQTGIKLWVGDGISGVGAWGPRGSGYILSYFAYGPLESEPLGPAGMTAVTLRTTLDTRLHAGTMYDTLDTINLENFEPQLTASFVMLTSFANEPRQFVQYRKIITTPDLWVVAFTRFQGQVVEYDPKTAWYKPVPNAIVIAREVNPLIATGTAAAAGALVGGSPITSAEAVGGFSQIIYVKTDDNGTFTVLGTVGMTQPTSNAWAYSFSAYVINQTTGMVEYAPDLGVYGAARFKTEGLTVTKPVNLVTIPIFRCGTLAIYDFLNPMDFSTVIAGVIDAVTQSPPDHYGGIGFPRFGLSLVFTDGRPVVIKAVDPQQKTIMLLLNASEARPEGHGFTVPLGKQLTIFASAQSAHDFAILSLTRQRILSEKGTSTPELIFYKDLLVQYNDQAQQLLYSKVYDQGYSKLIWAWATGAWLYNALMAVLTNTTNSVTVIFFLAFPFAIMFEELVLARTGLRRIYGIAIAYIIIFIPLSFVNPAFSLASNVGVVLLGTLVVALVIPVIGMVIDNFGMYLKVMRMRQVGAHFVERGGFSRTFTAFHVGLAHMRKRKLRTVLTLSALLVIAMSIMLFSSIYFFTAVMVVPSYRPTYFNGILVRQAMWGSLPWQLVHQMEGIFGTTNVSPRVWQYPSALSSAGEDLIIFNMKGGNYTIYNGAGFLALSPHDPLFTHLEALKAMGKDLNLKGRLFEERDLYSIILMSEYADALGVNPGDSVILDGIKFQVVGVIDSKALTGLIEYDGYTMLPRNILLANIEIRLDARNIIIFPLRFARLMGWNPNLIIVDLGGTSSRDVIQRASEFARLTYLSVYAGTNDEVYTVSSGAAVFSSSAFTTGLVLIITIASLVAANTLLANVYERIREIRIYSSIGMTPKDVGMMFLVQSLGLGVIGGFLGYVIGALINYAVYTTGQMPAGFTLNSSSLYVAISIVSVIVTSLLVAIYPFVAASKHVTPSLERVWKITTKPIGDNWTIFLPVEIHSREEVLASLRYLKEYLEAASVAERTSPFVASDVSMRTRLRGALEDEILEFNVRLAPYDAGIFQRVTVTALRAKEGESYSFELSIHRNAGAIEPWIKSNRSFADTIRKQLLMWKTLPPAQRDKYRSEA